MGIKISIIIVNWNAAALLRQCLNSLKSEIRNPKFGTEIIVVDNGSTDGSMEAIKDSRSKNYDLKIIKNKENYGFAKGNNIGLKRAHGDYIMLLNTDTIVKERAIEELAMFLDEHPEVSVVGPRLLNQDSTPQANCGWFPGLRVSFLMLFKEHFGGSDLVRFSPEKSQKVDWLMGAAFMARREVFDKIGGFDERVFMYMEEIEWFYRANRAGFFAYFNREIEIVHFGRGSSKSGKKDPIINIYKGLLHFYRVHRKPTEVLALRIMLKTKAGISYVIGVVKNDQYLKETYGQAFKIS